jgi:hypothetical protein
MMLNAWVLTARIWPLVGDKAMLQVVVWRGAHV